MSSEGARLPERLSLRADCERCFALCCVAPAFSASADFAIDKAPGRACPNLSPDFRCGIHGHLRQQGFRGCAVYDCLGAGQKVAQVTFGGRDWRAARQTAKQMFEVFAIMRQLHELLWYLSEAQSLPAARPLAAELGLAVAETERLTYGSPDSLINLDLAAHRQSVNALLLRASDLARAGASEQAAGQTRAGRPGASPAAAGRIRASPAAARPAGASPAAADRPGASPAAINPAGASPAAARPAGASPAAADPPGASPAAINPAGASPAGADAPGRGQATVDPFAAGPTGADRRGARLAGARLAGADLTRVSFRGADLTGASLTGARLLGVSLRGACLIGARLSGADLTLADLTGADLRDAELSGANLAGAFS